MRLLLFFVFSFFFFFLSGSVLSSKSAVIRRKKNRPALQRDDILTVFLRSSFFRENLFRSSSTQFLVVQFF